MARSHLLLVVSCLFVAAPAAAQDGVLLELYGKGVHAYFAGKSWNALHRFDTAIDAGSQDPRVFYFRGLTYLQLGDEGSAQQDFATAGELEVADSDEFYDVSRSLERIQGPIRLQIEEYRLAARVNALQRARQLQYERYERIRRAEPNVTIPPEVEEPVPPVDEPPMDEPSPMPPADEPASDPFTDPAEAPAEDPAMEEAPSDEPATPADEPPADEPAAPAEEPAEPAADAPEEMPADEPADAPVEEPAADVAPADAPADEPALDSAPADEPAAEPATDAPVEEPAAETPDAPAARIQRVRPDRDRFGADLLAKAGWRLFLLNPPVDWHSWSGRR